MPPKKKNPNAGQPIAVDSLKHTPPPAPTSPPRSCGTSWPRTKPRPRRCAIPRNPDLDPQLVWKGKDEQDRHPWPCRSVPVYIQEKIHPQAIIEDVRASAKQGQAGTLDLFSDFNGIEFDQLIEFYQHNQHWLTG